jgi:hypothetical protein
MIIVEMIRLMMYHMTFYNLLREIMFLSGQ